ncbi:hypothetical protein QP101_03210 [Aerococcus urinae]|uniref:hypothetical protein n=1 Tax=Aerococcus urinae TaxID=1376 RepID=UPI00254EE8A1|nr:hypothetical protein [Aerococcus urinae]MDK6371096.1 hypothetical protein [Aerococcus urinae]
MGNNTKKLFFYSVFFLAILLFLLGLLSGNIVFSLLSIVLGFIVYSKGDSILFKKYNDRVKERTKFRDKVMANMKNKNGGIENGD